MNRIDLLDRITSGLSDGTDPDGTDARGALLLAAETVTSATDLQAGNVYWDFCSIELRNAIARLQHGLPDDLVLAGGLPALDSDEGAVRVAIAAVLRRLADFYGHGAADHAGSPWRRLVWASVAHQLDAAAAELG